MLQGMAEVPQGEQEKSSSAVGVVRTEDRKQRKLNSNYRHTRSTDVQQKTHSNKENEEEEQQQLQQQQWELKKLRSMRCTDRCPDRSAEPASKLEEGSRAKAVARFAEQITPHLLPKY